MGSPPRPEWRDPVTWTAEPTIEGEQVTLMKEPCLTAGSQPMIECRTSMICPLLALSLLTALIGCTQGWPSGGSLVVESEPAVESAEPVEVLEEDLATLTPGGIRVVEETTLTPRPSPVGLWGENIARSRLAGMSLDEDNNISPVSFASEGAIFDPSIDGVGERLVFASTMHRHTSDIYVQQVGGRTMTQITTDPADDVNPVFDPDGEMIAFASNRRGNWDIYVTPAEGGRPQQITNSLEHDVHPTWSPDGTQLAFSRYGARSGRWEIWLVDLQNPTKSRFLTYGLFPKWSPDPARNKLLFQRARQRGSEYHSVWTVDLIEHEAMYPTEIVSAANAALISPSWAPDGSRIVFSSVVNPLPGEAPREAEIWSIGLNGTGRRSLVTGPFANTQPVWSPDGTVFFVSDRSGVENIWSVPASSSVDLWGEQDRIVTVPEASTGPQP